MEIKAGIFREYDIRGVVGPDIDETLARALGYVFAKTVCAECPAITSPRVAVG